MPTPKGSPNFTDFDRRISERMSESQTPHEPGGHVNKWSHATTEDFQNGYYADGLQTGGTQGLDWMQPDEDHDLQEMGKDPFRQFLAKVFASIYYDCSLGFVLVLQLVQIIVETDHASKAADDPGLEGPRWSMVVGYSLTVVYIIEISLRLYLMRRAFFHSWSNVMDLTIIVGDSLIGIIAPTMPSFSALRMFRLMRMGRAHKLVGLVPELSLMMRGMQSAARSIFWGMSLVTVVLVMWSIAAVQIIHPLNKTMNSEDPSIYDGCERCPRAFETVWASVLTFSQHLLAGDSWGAVSIPLIERHPWTYVYFLAVLSTVTMGLLNLIMAVIVDASTQTRKESAVTLCLSKEKDNLENAAKLARICQELDADGGGTLTFGEMMKGYYTHPEFRLAMKSLDLTREDMKMVFQILDGDGDGSVDFREFVKCMMKMKSADSPSASVFMQHYIQLILQDTKKQAEFRNEMKIQVVDTKVLVDQIRKDLDNSLKEEMLSLKNDLIRSSSLLAPGEPTAAAPGEAPMKTLEEALRASAADGAKEATRQQQGSSLGNFSAVSTDLPSWDAATWDAADTDARPGSPGRATSMPAAGGRRRATLDDGNRGPLGPAPARPPVGRAPP